MESAEAKREKITWWVGSFKSSQNPLSNWDIHHGLELDEAEYRRLADAIALLRRFGRPEHLLLVASNFDGFRRLMDQVTQFFLRIQPREQDYEHVQRVLRSAFFNWLLSFRAYLDHTAARLKRAYGKDSPQARAFGEACSKEYDGEFAYRFMYKLREFAQHSDFPPLSVVMRQNTPEPGALNISVVMECSRGELLAWSGWKKLRPELESLPEKFPITPHMGAVMESVNRIEEVVEAQEGPEVESARSSLGGTLEAIRNLPGKPLVFEQLERDGRIERMDMLNIPEWLLEPDSDDGEDAERGDGS